MEAIIKEYLEWKGTYAPRASVNYRIWLRHFIQVCGNKSPDKYEVADLVKYRQWMDVRYSPYTIQFAIVALKNFLLYCKMQNYECLSPTLVRIPTVIAKSHRAVTEKEYNLILSVIPTKDFRSLRDLLMIRMLWDTGMRVSELCDVNISQIDENKRSTIILTKKARRRRTIVWSEQTHKLLMKYITLRMKIHSSNSSALFIGWTKGKGWSLRVSTRSVQRAVKYFVDRAGIKERITPHSFRHGWAHKRRDQNASLSFIQKGLGHLSPYPPLYMSNTMTQSLKLMQMLI